MPRSPRAKPLPDRVEDLEDEVWGDPNDPKDDGLVGSSRRFDDLASERAGLLRAARIIGLLTGIAIGMLTLLEAVRRAGGGT
jgi:hypothetical protein